MNNIIQHQYKTKNEFLQDVMHEINHIKKHATAEEIDNLNFSTFNPLHATNCIYGQMTGRCSSDRAKELHNKQFKMMPVGTTGYTFSEVNKHGHLVKYKTLNKIWKGFSPLEMYIPMNRAKNKSIIQYLKGEKESLTL